MQLQLFDAPMPPRSPRNVSKAVHCTILALRKSGYRVFRCGRQSHSIDGKRGFSTKQLLQFANTLKRGLE